ncbi:hypothetical protein H5P28_07670 [Ruficoccus amylovorans]|uniref:Uncharacterized protein n=1 Tax=Ruficoccus amylovorans TaxID=1804625 RepID=A0A842HD66_9BACT|nr:hypothetical protein [Ruficoccus amylovorans]MBC2594139.1 hypothetical protein [Ruficoccus amylovorans]
MSFSVIFIFIGFAVLVLIIRLVAGSLDDDRVEQYVRDMGGELLDKSWAPFGPGWFGEKNDRIYEIVYRDRAGLVHRAHVKTSMFSGVYLTRDRIIEGSPPNPARAPHPDPLAPNTSLSIEEEKAALRRRLAELEKHSTNGN